MPDLKQRLNKWWLRTGQHGMTGQSSTIENRSSNLSESSQASAGTPKEKIRESSTMGGQVEIIENDDPLKKRITYPRGIGSLDRWIRRQRIFWKPPLTREEKFDLEQKGLARKNYQVRQAECIALNRLIPNSYASLGIEYVRTSKSKHEREKVERVTFEKWEWDLEGTTAWGKVKTIPYGKNATQLVDPAILSHLTVSIHHPVRGILDDKLGVVMISVSLAGTLNMPDRVDFDTVFPLISESAPP